MIKVKTKGRKKLTRSAREKPYYERFRKIYDTKRIKRRANREKRLAAVEAHPEIGSPSQLRMRRKRANKALRLSEL